ncbi:hypothetical protein EPO56_00750 [Patescibacteria group bacterium]|nr:MAG: hypothetical protein EPO56_00750 [Patescibacteria group bacterium]
MHEAPNTSEAMIDKETMSLTEIQAYVAKNAVRAELPKGIPKACSIECIDDRCTRSPLEIEGESNVTEKRKSIAFPGGALGVFATLLSGINESLPVTSREALTQGEFSFKAMASFFEKEFCGISCHTDSHNTHSDSACAGCGHLASILSNDAYRLGTNYQTELGQYAKDIQKRKEAHDESATVYTYHGDHASKAVVRILKEPSAETYISLPPNDGENGMFVLNEATNMHILELAGRKLYKAFETGFADQNIPEETLLKNISVQYGQHVGLTAKKLAHGLPVYDVTVEGENTLVTKSAFSF